MGSPNIQTLYHVDGFDLIDYDRAFLKYNGYVDGPNQGSIIPGQGGGSAIFTFNSAFSSVGAQFSKIMGPVSQLGIHLDYQFTGTGPGIFDWYSVNAGSTRLLTIHQRGDGKLDFNGPLGLITTTAFALSPGFSNLVILISFGTAGGISCFVNGVSAFSQLVEPCNFGSSLPDRAMFFWNAGFGPPGIAIDNYFLYDGLANVGPCHVDSYLPIGDSPSTSWGIGATSPDVPSSTCWPMVNDNAGRFPGAAPDGDFTYITPSPTANQTFLMQGSRCYGKVLGVALNACGRPNAGFAPQSFNFVAQLSDGLHVVGTGTLINTGAIASDPALANYQTVQAFMVNSPVTGSNWLDSEITNGNFGVGSIELQQRITAFNLEKITSLTPQPFSCGGASYSY